MTHDDVISFLRNHKPPARCMDEYVEMLVALTKKAEAEEREECAKVCDGLNNGRQANAADLCADGIRARSGYAGD